MRHLQTLALLMGWGNVLPSSLAAAQEGGVGMALVMPTLAQIGRFELAIGDAVLSGGLLYLVFRLIVGFPFRKSKHKPHSLAALVWVMGAHFLCLGLIGSTDRAMGALAFLVISPVAMALIYHKLDQAYQAEQPPSPAVEENPSE